MVSAPKSDHDSPSSNSREGRTSISNISVNAVLLSLCGELMVEDK